MSLTLGELATQFGCEVAGDPAVRISGVATLAAADAGAISFFANSAYGDALAATKASAVILKDSDLDKCPVNALISENPYLTYARVADAIFPDPPPDAGVHASAHVSETARVARSAQIAANAVVDADCEIGEHVYIGPGVFVGPRCRVGDRSRLAANCTLVQDVTIGKRSIIHSGAVIGSDGFGNAMSDSGWVKVKQLGGVLIGDDVEIGANTTVDRAAIDNTIIGNGVRLDNLIQIGHNAVVGEHTAMVTMTAIGGSAIVGKRCMFAGRTGCVGHITICDDVIVSATSWISKDIKEPGVYTASFPAEKDKSWKRKAARIRRIEDIVDRIKKLEKSSDDT